MALTGVHIACGYGGGSGKNGLTLPVLRKPFWSETMASAGTTSNSAPAGSQSEGDPLFYIETVAAIFVAVGPTPDATNGPRLYLPVKDGQGGITFYAASGDKVAWVLA